MRAKDICGPTDLDEMLLDYDVQIRRLTGPQYQSKALLDRVNSRIKVQRHKGENLTGLIKELLELARGEDLTKISALGREDEWETFLSRGFVLEGILKGYYRGDDGYLMARFLDPRRRSNEEQEEENLLIEEILEAPAEVDLPNPEPGLDLRDATLDDAAALAEMYDRVFASSYPTPIYDEDFLVQEMKEGMLYKAVWDGDKPVSAASADMDRFNLAAELTDCGTIPEYRGHGLITLLIHALEEDLRHQGFRSFYGMARSVSYGMNLVFRRFGYAYRGRLINHAHICGKFEDLNVWVKPLQLSI